MKTLYLILFLLITTVFRSFAQSTGVFNLRNTLQNDTLLTGWVFHGGDQAVWAKPGFNDHDWQRVIPDTDVRRFEALKKSGIGWLRLRVKAPYLSNKQQLAAWVYQFSASEIYLNGVLIKRYGTVNTDPAKVQAFSPGHELFVLPLKNDTVNVIAVRIAYQPGLPYIAPNYIPIPAFSLYLNHYPKAAEGYAAYQASVKSLIISYMLFLGMFVFITLIHLLYFAYDRSQRVHLYYAAYTFFIALACAVSIPFFDNTENVTVQMLWDIICCASNIIGSLFALKAIYTILNYRSTIASALLTSIGLVCFALVFTGGGTGFLLCVSVFTMIVMLEASRVSLWGIRAKRKDAIVILPFVLLCIILSVWSALLVETSLLSQFIGGLSFVCLPVGMAVYLGTQNSLRNRRLAESLTEVQTLSEQKQRLLADQNTVLEKQVAERTAALNTSLIHLKQTQNQLIQSEKMASLGELTAGIAHEIQNPLNFVNNFSDVNQEMLEELREELDKGDIEEAKAIAADIKANELKISHHGKRADAIVKGMLEHSKAGSGEKQLTDLNQLVEEFLQLAYHGMRAKIPTFQADIIRHFDANLPKAEIIPQDIGKVFLNLFNNAFYAVNQRRSKAGPDYKPLVEVSTMIIDNYIEIRVRDNGTGIADDIKDKIMQPFFTTKPTGEGVGLGLSLSYDIVVKAHGGKLELESATDDHTTFTVRLPLN